MENNMNDVEKVKKNAIDALNVIKIYCQTMGASGYSSKELQLLKSEFEPILNQCDRTIRELGGTV